MRSAGMSATLVSSVRSRRKKPFAPMVPLNAIEMSALSVSIQPDKATGVLPGFQSSTHSSAEEAAVPAQATSLISTVERFGVKVGVTVEVFDGRGVSSADSDSIGDGVIEVAVSAQNTVGVTVAELSSGFIIVAVKKTKMKTKFPMVRHRPTAPCGFFIFSP
jgi:hypothetical protein